MHFFLVFKAPECDIKSIYRGNFAGYQLKELVFGLNLHAFRKARIVETVGIVKGEKGA